MGGMREGMIATLLRRHPEQYLQNSRLVWYLQYCCDVGPSVSLQVYVWTLSTRASDFGRKLEIGWGGSFFGDGWSFLKIGVLPKEGLLALVGSIGKHTQSFQIIQKHSSTYLPPCVMNGIFLKAGRAGFCMFLYFLILFGFF